MIICEFHGRTGIVIGMLREICNQISNDVHLNQDELATVRVDYYDGEELLFCDQYLVTKQYKHEFDLKDYYKISSEEEDMLIYKLIGSKTGAICGKCYEEYLLRHNGMTKHVFAIC